MDLIQFRLESSLTARRNVGRLTWVSSCSCARDKGPFRKTETTPDFNGRAVLIGMNLLNIFIKVFTL